MEWVVKASAGALVVVIISLLARSQHFFIAGLVPVFPTFTLIAHYTVSVARTPADVKATVLFTMWSVIPYMMYLITMYLLVERVKMSVALASAVLAWLSGAAVLVLVWTRQG